MLCGTIRKQFELIFKSAELEKGSRRNIKFNFVAFNIQWWQTDDGKYEPAPWSLSQGCPGRGTVEGRHTFVRTIIITMRLLEEKIKDAEI